VYRRGAAVSGAPLGPRDSEHDPWGQILTEASELVHHMRGSERRRSWKEASARLKTDYSTVQYSTVHHSTVQCSAVLCSAVLCSTVLCSGVLYIVVRYCTVL